MTVSKNDIIDELHKPARRNYPRRSTITLGIDNLWQADLVEMDSGNLKGISKINKGYKYLLTIIDTFSKFAWAIPVKNKTGESVSKAISICFKNLSNASFGLSLSDVSYGLNLSGASHSRTEGLSQGVDLNSQHKPPKNLQTDNGKEFYNKDFKKLMEQNKINHYSTYSDKKAAIVERFNRSLKELMWKQFSIQDNYKWVDILPNLLNIYNNRKHRTIGMTPCEASYGLNPKDASSRLDNSPKDASERHLKMTSERLSPRDAKSEGRLVQGTRFKVGDYVRINKLKHMFEKGYTPNWSTEIFVIDKVFKNIPPYYPIKDMKGEEIKATFYEQELQKTKIPTNIYLVEKILKRKGNKVYVKWLGFDNTHNQWINKKDLITS
ncbi:uncharacterized protein [Polyergus mexicanus]|uniref:uncharacterized protein n=1 Tax=Polyergus mexicanus TaxID=615972 RepID=UPI0038B4DA1C